MRLIVGSFLSALIGIVVGGLILGVIFARSFEGVAFMFEISALLVLPVWLLLLLPLYVFVPRTSVLWHWALATPMGCLAGALLLLAYSGFGFPPHTPGPLLPVAAIVGAATCLFGSLTAPYFRARDHGTQKA